MSRTTSDRGPAGPALVVIPCSGAKLWHPAPAGELYTGTWHKLARGTADALVAQHGGQVVILSALHGLLRLGDVIEPYDLAMGDAGSITPGHLALQLLELLTQHQGVGTWSGDQLPTVIALLPRAYRERLAAAIAQLPAAAQPQLVDPLHGASGVGYQRQRLATMRDAGLALA